MKRHCISKATLVLTLSLALMAASCNQIQAYINLAVGIALQVARLAGLPKTTADQVAGDLATVNKLITDYKAADSSVKPGKLAELDAVLNTAQADLTAILMAVHVSNPKTQAVIQASIGIAITAVESIRDLVLQQNSALKTTASKTVRIALPGGVTPPKKLATPDQLRALYNQTVKDYPEAQLH